MLTKVFVKVVRPRHSKTAAFRSEERAWGGGAGREVPPGRYRRVGPTLMKDPQCAQ
jgi:hypothetical protein